MLDESEERERDERDESAVAHALLNQRDENQLVRALIAPCAPLN